MTTRTTDPGPTAARTPVMSHAGAAAYPLSWLLAVVTVPACILTLAMPDVLRGPAAMNGSARGTAAVMLVAAVPLLVVSMEATRRGSTRALALWIGSIAFLCYNAVMLLLGSPFNALFLLYDAILGLSIWAAITLLHRIDIEAVAARVTLGVRTRWVAVFIWVVVGLNTGIWLKGVVAGMLTDGTPAFLVGTGLTTLPTYVQDLAFWLPLSAVVAWWLWRGRPWGFLLSAALLANLVLEALAIAADQAFAHAADPASPVASLSVVPVFLAVAVACAVPLAHLLRHLQR